MNNSMRAATKPLTPKTMVKLNVLMMLIILIMMMKVKTIMLMMLMIIFVKVMMSMMLMMAVTTCQTNYYISKMYKQTVKFHKNIYQKVPIFYVLKALTKMLF